jgi:hypothetical protein
MAQFLIKALEPWNNDSPTAPEERSRLGDIIVVRPDGHVWGNEECLPRFIVVKITNMTYDDAKHLEESLLLDDGLEEDGVTIKKKLAKVRKWQVPQAYMLDAIQKGDSVVEITLTNKQLAFIANLIEKTS